jgi:hypothetical protein
VAATPLQLSADIQATDGRIGSIEQDIKRKEDRLNQLISLRAQQETRLDQLVSRSTTGNNTTIRSAQSALTAADRNVTSLQNEISKLSEQRDSLRGITIGKQVEIETNGDIGTFVYIAKMFGVPLDVVVKWFTLIIVLVFDPLAVALVISVNFLIKNKQMVDTVKEPIIESKNEMPAELISPIENKTEVITNEKDVTEEKNDVEEPYKVYATETSPVEEVPQVQLNNYLDLNKDGIPDWMEPSFDWNNVSNWINNPVAKLYKQQIVDKGR